MTTNDISTWPMGLKRLAELIGPAKTQVIADRLGGTVVYIPKAAVHDHFMSRLIGFDNWNSICAELGPGHYDIPRGAFMDCKKAQILDAVGTNHEVALRLGVTKRYVRQVRNAAGIPADQRQGDLFTPQSESV